MLKELFALDDLLVNNALVFFQQWSEVVRVENKSSFRLWVEKVDIECHLENVESW
jgi:hypothetical protein